MLKVELGGGNNPQEGFVNVDKNSGDKVQYVMDFEQLYPEGDQVLPFDDDSVDMVYSSHCFEHVLNLKGLLWETVRICKVNAIVEIRVPHYLSPMAMCHDHKQVIPPEQIDHWCKTALEYWWKDGEVKSKKRLIHMRTQQIPGAGFNKAKMLFPHLDSESLMELVPGAAHEIRYLFRVIPND